MREILFRGKRTDNGEWVYGSPIFQDGYVLIRFWNSEEFEFEEYLVLPESVSEFTGLTDKNGKRIFEGDIVQIKDFTHGCALNYKQPTSNWVVHWREDIARFCIDYMSYLPFDFTKTEIIGNIHDNPELLKPSFKPEYRDGDPDCPICPNCRTPLNVMEDCDCGQKIDWSDT